MDTTVTLRPMLACNGNPRDLLRLAEDDNIAYEQKVDGMRLLVSITETRVDFRNRKGETFKQYLPPGLDAQLATLGPGFVLDGELVEDTKGRRTLFIFDVLDTPAGTTIQKPFSLRRNLLEHIFGLWSAPGVELLPSYTGRVAKLTVAKRLLENGAEGVIAKALDAIYVPGLRSPGLQKLKFVKEIDVVVTGKRINGKDNLAFGVYSNGRLVPLGEVTALAGDGDKLEVGDVACVQYLYAVDPNRPKLVQPTRPLKRTDKAPEECTLDQINFTDKTVLRVEDLNL